MITEYGIEVPESDEDCALLHNKYEHSKRGYGDDWEKCQTPRCRENFRRQYYYVREYCPHCGQSYEKKVATRQKGTA